jgi:hypothetical protein
MPLRKQPDIARHVDASLMLPDAIEESESLSRIKRWLDMADVALENPRAAK